jgi:hypothetical protein
MDERRFRLPASVRPGPVTIPPRSGNYRPAAAPPALPSAAPRNTACKLIDYLRGHGLTRIYSSAQGDVANVSLPRLTIWIRPRTLNWTHRGQVTTWPVCDTAGAARHLAQLVQQPMPPLTQREAHDDEWTV